MDKTQVNLTKTANGLRKIARRVLADNSVEVTLECRIATDMALGPHYWAWIYVEGVIIDNAHDVSTNKLIATMKDRLKEYKEQHSA